MQTSIQTATHLVTGIQILQKALGDGFRKDGKTPAISHSILVFMLCVKYFPKNHFAWLIGMLHDVIEDSPTNSMREDVMQEIKSNLGDHILQGVLALTDAPSTNNWEKRKYDQIDKYLGKDALTQALKLVDVLANLIEGPAPSWGPEKIIQYTTHKAKMAESLGTSHQAIAQAIQEELQAPKWQISYA